MFSDFFSDCLLVSYFLFNVDDNAVNRTEKCSLAVNYNLVGNVKASASG